MAQLLIPGGAGFICGSSCLGAERDRRSSADLERAPAAQLLGWCTRHNLAAMHRDGWGWPTPSPQGDGHA